MAEFSRELPFDYDPDSKVGDSTRSTVRAWFTVQKLYKTFCIPLSIKYHLQQAQAYFSKVDYYQTIFSLSSFKKFLPPNMRFSIILPVAIAGLTFARPQGGSMNVLGFCVCGLLDVRAKLFTNS